VVRFVVRGRDVQSDGRVKPAMRDDPYRPPCKEEANGL
jgi:hypothetical protein